jgi:ATP-dependent Lon protease
MALPIGGLREKSLAALRSGIKTIIVPEENKKDVSELPEEVKKGAQDRVHQQR